MKNAVLIGGVLLGLGGMITPLLVSWVPWWTFFISAVVIPITGPVARMIAFRTGEAESDLRSPGETGIAPR